MVDGQAYRLMGTAPVVDLKTATQTAVEFTPTRTSFIFTAGPMQVNMTLISPVEVCIFSNLIFSGYAEV